MLCNKSCWARFFTHFFLHLVLLLLDVLRMVSHVAIPYLQSSLSFGGQVAAHERTDSLLQSLLCLLRGPFQETGDVTREGGGGRREYMKETGFSTHLSYIPYAFTIPAAATKKEASTVHDASSVYKYTGKLYSTNRTNQNGFRVQ